MRNGGRNWGGGLTRLMGGAPRMRMRLEDGVMGVGNAVCLGVRSGILYGGIAVVVVGLLYGCWC